MSSHGPGQSNRTIVLFTLVLVLSFVAYGSMFLINTKVGGEIASVPKLEDEGSELDPMTESASQRDEPQVTAQNYREVLAPQNLPVDQKLRCSLFQEALRSETTEVRQASLEATFMVDEDARLDILAAHLREEANPDLLQRTIRELGQLTRADPVPTLLAFAIDGKTPSEGVVFAIQVLGARQDERVIEPMIELLSNGNASVAFFAEDALRRFQPDRPAQVARGVDRLQVQREWREWAMSR